jgi:hypothetical protein
MQDMTKPVAAKDLGVLGKDHFTARFKALGRTASFAYKRIPIEDTNAPCVLEMAFAFAPSVNINSES